jgi:magnesium-protoporphyrin O-methyltransferase
MECCSHCQDTSELFDRDIAERELRQYRRDGLSKKSARLLVDGLKSLDIDDRTLLDIGGGVGAIPFELLGAGASEATLVEASEEYIDVAEKEAQRRGYNDRLDVRFGDFVDMAPELPTYDIVTLDRVICCYPHLEKLVEASTARASRWYGVVYPKERWYTNLGEKFAEVYCGLKGMDFRVYIHDGVDETIQQQGFTPFYDVSTILWRVTLYERDASDQE